MPVISAKAVEPKNPAKELHKQGSFLDMISDTSLQFDLVMKPKMHIKQQSIAQFEYEGLKQVSRQTLLLPDPVQRNNFAEIHHRSRQALNGNSKLKSSSNHHQTVLSRNQDLAGSLALNQSSCQSSD